MGPFPSILCKAPVSQLTHWMSSAVNKSSTRFTPKAALRGSIRPNNPRGKIRASFSVVDHGHESISDHRTSEFEVSTSSVNQETQEMDGSRLIKDNKDTSKPSDPVKLTTRGTVERMVSIGESPQVAPQLRLETVSTPMQPTLKRARFSNVKTSASSHLTSYIASSASSQPLEAPSPQGATSVGAPQNVSVDTPKRYDQRGREIINPTDLPKLGRGHLASDVTLENKAINVETFTMANLCQDIPIGETNDDYLKFEKARMSRKRHRARILKAKQMMKGLYEPKRAQVRENLETVYKEYHDEREERFGSDLVSYPAASSLNDPAPKLEYGAAGVVRLLKGKDGQIQLDSESQTLDRHANVRTTLENSQSTVEIDKYSTVINSYSFSKKERPERWSPKETDKFYYALSVWGTDFNLISHMFPTRTRHQIKTKFKYEEKRNSAKVQLFLVHRRSINVTDYARVSGKDIYEVEKLEDEFRRIHAEHETQVKLELELKQKAIREDRCDEKTTVKFEGSKSKQIID